MRTVSLPSTALLHPQQKAAWELLVGISNDIGSGWTLVGGQMVTLHQVERTGGISFSAGLPNLRISQDLDLVVDIRVSKNKLTQIHKILEIYGFDQQIRAISHRYLRDSDGLLVDVLVPENLGTHLPRLGGGKTFQAIGSSQALKRSEPVMVSLEASQGVVYRPNLVGAIVMKSKVCERVGKGGQRYNRDLEDVATLTALLTEEDLRAVQLKPKERALLRGMLPKVSNMLVASGLPLTGITFLEKLAKQYPTQFDGDTTSLHSRDKQASRKSTPPTTCNRKMPKAQRRCVLVKGHKGACRSKR